MYLLVFFVLVLIGFEWQGVGVLLSLMFSALAGVDEGFRGVPALSCSRWNLGGAGVLITGLFSAGFRTA